MIFGEAEYEAMRNLLSNQKYQPIRLHPTQKGIVSIWILDNKESTAGPYRTVEVYLHVSPVKDGVRLAVEYNDNPANLIYSLFGKLPEESRMYMLNNFATPTHDISKLLDDKILGVQQETIDVEKTIYTKDDDRLVFKFVDAEGRHLIEGTINEQKKNSWLEYFKNGWQIIKGLGLSGVLDLRDAPVVTLRIASPVNSKSRSTLLHVHTNFEKATFRAFDANDGDSIVLSPESELGRQLSSLGFEPKYVAHLPLYQDAIVVPSDQSEGA